jgi:hypothetical protein
MKSILIALGISIITTVSFAGSLAVPEVFFEYGGTYDYFICPNLDTKPITKEMLDEYDALMPVITAEWNKNGVPLMSKSVQILQAPYGRKELTVDFVLCDLPVNGMSYPLIIKLREFLRSATPNTLPMLYFIGAIHHEFLHRYLKYFDAQISNSALRKKYESESLITKNHLHLLSMQQYSYISLNREVEFEELMKIQAARPNGAPYARAYEIIKEEGYMAFVNELL